jgi:hypothetical protein
MEDLSGSYADHLISKLNLPVLALIAGFALLGDFERDGTQHGAFTMTRAAGVHGHGD